MLEKVKVHLNAAFKYCLDVNKETVNSFVVSLANKNATLLNRVLHKLLLFNNLNHNSRPTKIFEEILGRAVCVEVVGTNNYNTHPAVQKMRDNIKRRTESLKKNGYIGTIRYSKPNFQKLKENLEYDSEPLFISVDTSKPDLGSFSSAINEMGTEKLNSLKEALQKLSQNPNNLNSLKSSLLKETLKSLDKLADIQSNLSSEPTLEVVEDIATSTEEVTPKKDTKKKTAKKTVKKVSKKTVKKK